MKLNYKHTRILTTADFFNMCNPPLIFEVRVRPGSEWSVLFSEFERDGADNPEMARALIALAFLTVSDGGEVYPLDHVDKAQALQDAIENENPGSGDEFICSIAWGFGRNYYRYLSDHLGNSLRPLEQSNGKAGDPTPVKVS